MRHGPQQREAVGKVRHRIAEEAIQPPERAPPERDVRRAADPARARLDLQVQASRPVGVVEALEHHPRQRDALALQLDDGRPQRRRRGRVAGRLQQHGERREARFVACGGVDRTLGRGRRAGGARLRRRLSGPLALQRGSGPGGPQRLAGGERVGRALVRVPGC